MTLCRISHIFVNISLRFPKPNEGITIKFTVSFASVAANEASRKVRGGDGLGDGLGDAEGLRCTSQSGRPKHGVGGENSIDLVDNRARQGPHEMLIIHEVLHNSAIGA